MERFGRVTAVFAFLTLACLRSGSFVNCSLRPRKILHSYADLQTCEQRRMLSVVILVRHLIYEHR
jgi:hypothetical protein